MALILAIVVGFKFLGEASGWLAPYIESQKLLLPILAFLLLAGFTFFGLLWFGKLARKSIRYTLLGAFDRAAGALLGLFRTAFILSSLLFGLEIMQVKIIRNPKEKLWIYQALAQMGPASMKVLRPLFPFLSRHIPKI